MVEVVNILFKDSNKTYYFSPNGINSISKPPNLVIKEAKLELKSFFLTIYTSKPLFNLS